MSHVTQQILNLRQALQAKFHEQGVLHHAECHRMQRMAAAKGFGLNPMDFDKSTLGPLVNSQITNHHYPPQEQPPATPPPTPPTPPSIPTPVPVSPGAPSLLSRLAPGLLLALGLGGTGAAVAAGTYLLTRPSLSTSVQPQPTANENDYYYTNDGGRTWQKAPVLSKPPQ